MASKAEILASLRGVETELFSRDFQKWLRKQPEAERKRIRTLLADFTIAIDTFKNKQLDEIIDRLELLEPELTHATAELDKELDDLKTFKKAVETAGKVLGILLRVVSAVA